MANLTKPVQLIVTCEHAVNTLPPELIPLKKRLSRNFLSDLAGHRGWDPGAKDAQDALLTVLNSHGIEAWQAVGRVTRLVGDLNRRPSSNELIHPEISRICTPRQMQKLLDQYYHPYRAKIASQVTQSIAQGHRVIHVAMHSFTPELNGVIRKADIGLLYDPKRSTERKLITRWISELERPPKNLALGGGTGSKFLIRRNYPYLGVQDGLASWLRRDWNEDEYLGIEVELNQALRSRPDWADILSFLADTFLLATGITPGIMD